MYRIVEAVLLCPLFEIEGSCCGRLGFWLLGGIFGLRGLVEFLGVERSCGRFWELVRFNISTWVSVSNAFLITSYVSFFWISIGEIFMICNLQVFDAGSRTV